MRKWISVLLTCALAAGIALGAAAADTAGHLVVSDVSLSTTGLPTQPYADDGVYMVPLRLIAEQLGYTVAWDSVTGAITVDDDYIQKAVLYGGSTAVSFEGHLQVINMSRDVEMERAAVILDGVTYVPLSFFTEFFNDTAVDGNTIVVAPSMAELQ